MQLKTIPISFKWVLKAKDKGAEVIHVDPRFTRTSARSSMYAPLRSGTDIAFLGGMIKYILDHDLYFKDYVLSYTNAAFLVNPKFSFNDGLFSGYDAQKHAYDKSSWSFQKDGKGLIKRDDTLKNPHCVFQLMKKHYDRYDLKKVSSITGTPEADLLAVYKSFAATGKPDKAGTMHVRPRPDPAYLWRVQNIARHVHRCSSCSATSASPAAASTPCAASPTSRGPPTTPCCRITCPATCKAPQCFAGRRWSSTSRAPRPRPANPQSLNWMSNTGKYATSLMRAFYPEGGTPENGFGYDYLPKLDDGQDASVMMHDRRHVCEARSRASPVWARTPRAASRIPIRSGRRCRTLNWMVHVNIFDNETASFWKRPRPRSQEGEDRSASCFP